MLEASARRIVARVGANQHVLDVGGGARPFARADVVLDIMEYGSRGQLGWNGDRSGERFGSESWIQRDLCDRQPWPFADREFDFAVCSHTLEDIRDPVWVAAELQRVATAGYIEVPTLQEELTYGIQGPWVGWGHHRWLVFVQDGGIEFLFKHHVVNRPGSHLPAGAVAALSPADRVQTLWWEDAFSARERFMWTAAELDGFLGAMAGAGALKRPYSRSRARIERVARAVRVVSDKRR